MFLCGPMFQQPAIRAAPIAGRMENNLLKAALVLARPAWDAAVTV